MSSDTAPTNYIFATDHVDPLKVGQNERRFIVQPQEDGIKKQFEHDLEKYLTETFCTILPNKE